MVNVATQLEVANTSPQDTPTFIDHPSGFLAFNSQNGQFALDGIPGFISFREQGRHLIAFGGVHAAASDRGKLLDGFVTHAKSRGRCILFVQVREGQAGLFLERGFTVNQFGTSFGIDLRRFNLSGTAKMQLRNKINHARRLGLRIAEVGHEIPRDENTFSQLHAISEEWLRCKGKELDFMIGEIGKTEEVRRRIFMVFDPSSEPVGFITYVPVWGRTAGYLHDLTRRLPTAPPGAMELCNAFAIARMVQEGVAFLHFGFTPFITDKAELPGSNRVVAWVIRQLRKYGNFIYPAESQARYKLKWGPQVIEREYVAALPLSVRSIIDLLILTRSV